MKVRTSFVSNSSSSSFIILKDQITEEQQTKVLNYKNEHYSIWKGRLVIWGKGDYYNDEQMVQYFEEIGLTESMIEWGE